MEVEQEFGDEVVFLGVPGLSNADPIREFVKDLEVGDIQHVNDESLELWDRFGVTRQRTYAFVDNDGTFRLSGYGSLRDDVQQLIASPGGAGTP